VCGGRGVTSAAPGAFDLEGLSGEGEQARTELAEALQALDAEASRSVQKRDEAAAK
jgi:acyl-[acyl-carrier-protein] desaturase